jgi:LytS/YehU family sensor histidine kinase
MLYGLLAPAVYLLVERAPLGREAWVRRGPLHLGAALLFAVVHLALATTLHLAVYRPSDLTWAGFYRSNLTGFLMSDVAQYVLLAVASHALLFHGRLRERELTALRLEARLAQARLQALTRQLSPHFLFNALNTVAALARRGDTDAVRDVVSDLADLLRLSLGESEGQLVPVHREIERLESYVAIQRVRYGSRLQVRLRLTPEIREARVPTMALQPLVENSIKHGLDRPDAALRVEVAVSGDDSTVEITVDDDGPGFPDSPAEVRPGVGLGNLRSRLQALYGSGHAFELGRSPLRGARVRLRIPREASPAPGLVADASGEAS